MNFEDFIFIINGIFTTLKFTIFGLILGFVIGLPIATMRISESKILVILSKVYISLIRGTPVLLQLSLWYFLFPRVTGIKISASFACIITFAINSSAYIAEIIRAGILGVDNGQTEAAKVLGIKKRDILLDIVLPQAIRNISPAIINEMISLTKETAIIGMIGITDLTRRAQLVSAEKYDYFMPLITAAACYYLIAIVISTTYGVVERFYKIK
jgi:His/Glu/Gln/Arg/opine family amino acid ABC transporter permease subunit